MDVWMINGQIDRFLNSNFVYMSFRVLKYDMSLMLFRVHEPPFVPIIRNITLKNEFDFPVVIYSAKFSSRVQNWFSVSVFCNVTYT